MLFIFKRFAQDSVTRTCNAWNTNVKRAEHERVTVNVTKNSDIKKESHKK